MHLERTFAEYKASLFATSEGGFETCAGCHMDARPYATAEDPHRRPARVRHEHLWAGVDVALTDFPDREAQRAAIECALSQNTRIGSIDHDGFGRFTVQVETAAGHTQPSGAAQDRRMWLEFVAYDADGSVMFESGTIADGELEEKPADDPELRPQPRAVPRPDLRRGRPAHAHVLEGRAFAAHPDGYRSLLLPR